MPRTYVFDLDGTLCSNTEGDYEAAVPFPWAIARLNALKRAGHHITIFTARGTTTGIDWRPTVERQLAEWGVEYDELMLGKPYGDVYVDDKALHVDAWRYGGHAHELDGPGHAPPRSTAVIEVMRTYGGRPYGVEESARRLLSAAADGGVVALPTVAGVVAAAGEATERRSDLLGPDDDIIAVLSIAGPAHAAFLDTAGDVAEAELQVTCRLLSQPVAGLRPLMEGHGVVAATDGRPGAWPLERDAGGALRSRFGGEVASVGEEILVLGMPFCALPVVRLDGEPVPTGPAYREEASRWRERTGVDVGAQLRALLARTA